ncbi:proliferation-associated protein 2G4-like [Xenia sp. Carnegie-2017]|uniref:proliferation-associated protein 2G4-like n=1 Tax=Xenia sp. Carnegie-2017 TaxID=2897299 RepID=UPI001F034DA6|nr:proliferation-associated protein 2G4-like [Xenia sp. Carnegie-2017]
MTDRASDSEGEEPTISEDVVVTKYKMAGDMANRVLAHVVKATVANVTARTLCAMGDALIEKETGNVYKNKKDMKKGVAFPTCVSVNNCVCHFTPLASDGDVEICDGDMVKIDLGIHIDGYIAVVGHTVVVGASKEKKVTGRKADVLLAAHYTSELLHRTVKPDEENFTVSDNIEKVAEAFKCKPVEGMLSHQLKRNVIDGEKSIIQNPNESQKKEHEKCTFNVHEVYAIDVLISSGDGKAKEKDTRTTVYKRTPNLYSLKMKTSRVFFSEISNKFTRMPFTLRAFDDEKQAKLGVVECVKHGLLEPYNVLWEKDGEYVAQFKFTVLLMPNGPIRITQGPAFDLETVESEYSITDESIKSILASSVSRKAQKKKKKKAATKPVDTPKEEKTAS